MAASYTSPRDGRREGRGWCVGAPARMNRVRGVPWSGCAGVDTRGIVERTPRSRWTTGATEAAAPTAGVGTDSSRFRRTASRWVANTPFVAFSRCVPAERNSMSQVNNGAHRASSTRTIHLALLSFLTLALAFGGFIASPTQATAASQVKVVIVVGPVEGSTSRYIEHARRLRRAGSRVRRGRHRGLQPARNVDPRQGRRGRRQHLHLPRPRQRPSQSVWRVLVASEERDGPQQLVEQRQFERQVLGPDLHADRARSGPQRGRPAQPPVLRLGQFRAGSGAADQVGRDAASRRLRHRLPAHRRQGGLRERQRRPQQGPGRPLHDRQDRRADLPG